MPNFLYNFYASFYNLYVSLHNKYIDWYNGTLMKKPIEDDLSVEEYNEQVVRYNQEITQQNNERRGVK